MGKNDLTVVIPVYNGEKYISRTLQSLQNQIRQSFNILIVNDGSTDSTKEIIEAFAANNANVSVINSPQNRGVSFCRNLGTKRCETTFITFLDHDDWIDINTYEYCLTNGCLNADITIFGLNHEYLDINVTEKKYTYKKDFSLTGDYALKIYCGTIKDSFIISPVVNNKIYRLNYLRKNDILFNERVRYQEDDIFTFEALLYADKVQFISDCKYHYFQNPESVIHTVSEISIKHFVNAYSDLKAYLTNRSLFEKYNNEYYLKLKSSLKSVIHRTVHYGKDKAEIQRLLALLYRQLNEFVNIEEFLAYCDLSQC